MLIWPNLLKLLMNSKTNNMKEILLILTILFANIAESLANEYKWKVLEVVDGDTIKVEIPNLPEELHASVRILGIDTPEKDSRAKCDEENILGHKATEYTKKIVKSAKSIIFSEIKWDKYGGRILAKVTIDGKDFAEQIISEKLARPYFGDKKKSWCN